MAYNKPIPVPQGESDVYWEKAKQRELWLRKCNDCGNSYFYPRDISPCCFSKDTEWVQASGKATLFTYGIVQRAPHPGFVDDVPFVTAVVELREPAAVDGEALRSDVRARLAGYKVPKRFVFVERIQRLPNGKSDYPWARGVAGAG